MRINAAGQRTFSGCRTSATTRGFNVLHSCMIVCPTVLVAAFKITQSPGCTKQNNRRCHQHLQTHSASAGLAQKRSYNSRRGHGCVACLELVAVVFEQTEGEEHFSQHAAILKRHNVDWHLFDIDKLLHMRIDSNIFVELSCWDLCAHLQKIIMLPDGERAPSAHEWFQWQHPIACSQELHARTHLVYLTRTNTTDGMLCESAGLYSC